MPTCLFLKLNTAKKLKSFVVFLLLYKAVAKTNGFFIRKVFTRVDCLLKLEKN
jgi:hypothetical protein